MPKDGLEPYNPSYTENKTSPSFCLGGDVFGLLDLRFFGRCRGLGFQEWGLGGLCCGLWV